MKYKKQLNMQTEKMKDHMEGPRKVEAKTGIEETEKEKEEMEEINTEERKQDGKSERCSGPSGSNKRGRTATTQEGTTDSSGLESGRQPVIMEYLNKLAEEAPKQGKEPKRDKEERADGQRSRITGNLEGKQQKMEGKYGIGIAKGRKRQGRQRYMTKDVRRQKKGRNRKDAKYTSEEESQKKR